MRYAINITDMSKDPIFAGFLIAPHIQEPRKIIRAEMGVVDGAALLLSIIDSRIIESMLFVLRKKYSRNLFRVYQSKTGNAGWDRI